MQIKEISSNVNFSQSRFSNKKCKYQCSNFTQNATEVIYLKRLFNYNIE